MISAPAPKAADIPKRPYSRLPPARAATEPIDPMKLMIPFALLRRGERVTSGMRATIGARHVDIRTAYATTATTVEETPGATAMSTRAAAHAGAATSAKGSLRPHLVRTESDNMLNRG